MKNVARFFTTLFLAILLVGGLTGCWNYCKDYVSQPYKFGRYPVDFKMPVAGLKIGDTLAVDLELPVALYDSVTRTNVSIRGDVIAFLPISRLSKERYDTSFVYVADRYVDIIVETGERKTPYEFLMARTPSGLKLSVRYVFKIPLNYYVTPSFRLFDVGQPKPNRGTCVLGDPNYDARLYVRTSVNQIDAINQELGYPLIDNEQSFGFIVR